jgi:hypothetical protein
VSIKVLFCSLPQLFDVGFLDSSERTYLDRHCHGLVEWCTLHFARKDFVGLCWIRPLYSAYDHVFVAQDHKFLQNIKSIKKNLNDVDFSLFLLEGLHSEKDFSEASKLCAHVEWVSLKIEDQVFGQI